MKFFNKTKFNFLNKAKFTTFLSVIFIVVSLFSLISKGGPKLSIDFTGGTIIQIQFEESMEIGYLRKQINSM